MKAVLLTLAFVVLGAVEAMGQARTAEKFVDRSFSQLSPNAPSGSVANCTTCLRAEGPCQLAGAGQTAGTDAVKLGATWYCSGHSPSGSGGDVVGPASSTDSMLPLFNGVTGKALKGTSSLNGYVKLTSGIVAAAPIPVGDLPTGIGADKIANGSVSNAEFQFLSNVSSDIQAQLNTILPNTRRVDTTTPLLGGGDLSANRTLSIADAAADASTKGAATFSASDFNSSAGLISLDYTNGPVGPGAITTSRLTMATNRLLGRTTASPGAIEEITPSANFIFSGGAFDLATVPLSKGGTNQTSWTAAKCVRVNAGGTALEAAADDCGVGGAGDMTLAGAQTVTGAKTFNDGTLILNGGDYGATDASLPGSPVEKAFYLNINAGSRRLFFYNNGSFRTLFQAGIDLVNLTSNVTGTLPLGNGGLGITSGTSGGVPYFSSSSTIASSAALTANLPVIGGGAGAAPTVGTRSGNTTAFVTTAGSQTSGRCVEIDANGNHIASAAGCNTGSGANAALSNLAAVAINTSLISDTDLTDDLGSVSTRWRDIWAGKLSLSGRTLSTDADLAAGIISGATTVTKNDSNTRTFFGALYHPVLNTGGSNANTTFNIIGVDTTNTAVTGLTTNLMNLSYGGASKFKVASDGTTTVPTGTLAVTIANGTSALGTSAIASGACASVVTTAATGTATTDVVSWGFNGDPTGVTGYAPSANGMLTIIAYPSANNVNFKVCNNLAASVTPGAITLNWRIVR